MLLLVTFQDPICSQSMSTWKAEGHQPAVYATWNNLHTEPIDYFHWLDDVDILLVQGIIPNINRKDRIPSM